MIRFLILVILTFSIQGFSDSALLKCPKDMKELTAIKRRVSVGEFVINSKVSNEKQFYDLFERIMELYHIQGSSTLKGEKITYETSLEMANSSSGRQFPLKKQKLTIGDPSKDHRAFVIFDNYGAYDIATHIELSDDMLIFEESLTSQGTVYFNKIAISDAPQADQKIVTLTHHITNSKDQYRVKTGDQILLIPVVGN